MDDRGDREFSPPSLRTPYVELRPISAAEHPTLQAIETVGPPAPRWLHRGATPSAAQWASTMNDPLANFLVVATGERVQDRVPIGRVFTYQPNFQDRYAYFAAVSFKPDEPSPVMMLGVATFLRYTFWYWDFEKLYMEVPEYNYSQFASGEGRFFEVEGRLRGHIRMGGRSWDQLILAVYRGVVELHAARLQVGEQRSPDRAVVASQGPDGWQVRGASVSWERFVTEVATIALVPAADIHEKTRLLEDLALDSLALAELAVVLTDKYDLHSPSSDLNSRTWQDCTVRALYDELVTSAPPAP